MNGPTNLPDFELTIRHTATPPAVDRREAWTDSAGGVCAWGSGNPDGGQLEVADVGVFRFTRKSNVVEAHVPLCTAEPLVRQALDQIVRPMALQTRGWQILHASAVAGPRGVIALSGRSGAGKSTLARIWSQARRRIFADDSLAYRVAHRAVEVARLPMELDTAVPQGAIEPLTAIVLLEPDTSCPAPGDFAKLPPVLALTELLRQAVCLDAENPALRRALFTSTLDLVQSLPVFRFRYRQTVRSKVEVVRRLEDELAAY